MDTSIYIAQDCLPLLQMVNEWENALMNKKIDRKILSSLHIDKGIFHSIWNNSSSLNIIKHNSLKNLLNSINDLHTIFRSLEKAIRSNLSM